MNEFREQLREQSKTFLTLDVYNANHRLLESKIESLQRFMYIITGGLVVLQLLVGVIEKYIP